MIEKFSAALVAMSFVAMAQPAVGQTAADAKVEKPAFVTSPSFLTKPAVKLKPLIEPDESTLVKSKVANAKADKLVAEAAASLAAAKRSSEKALNRSF